MHNSEPLLVNPTASEQAMLFAAIASFLVAWAVGFDAQEGIRQHLPLHLREEGTYRWWVDRLAFASTTPRALAKRYLLSHALLPVPCICGFVLSAMIANRNALYVSLFLVTLTAFNFFRSWRRFVHSTATDAPN